MRDSQINIEKPEDSTASNSTRLLYHRERVRTDAIRHNAKLTLMFIVITVILQLIQLIPVSHENPEWIYWLMWGPAVLGFCSFALMLHWMFRRI
jgi:uncharacterized membrane protein YcjF (UPF0283 family)